MCYVRAPLPLLPSFQRAGGRCPRNAPPFRRPWCWVASVDTDRWGKSVLLWSGRFGRSGICGRDVFLGVSGHDRSRWGRIESGLIEMADLVVPRAWVAEPFSKWGAQVHVKKTMESFFGVNWQLWRHKHWNMTSLPMHHMKV